MHIAEDYAEDIHYKQCNSCLRSLIMSLLTVLCFYICVNYWLVICVSFGITSTEDNQIQHGILQTRVPNCQLVSVKRNDFYIIMHRVRMLLA